MSKSVIYIDTEDDITSIIDRVKEAESDIVALVPPKRNGVLQSVVNLKLLKRSASGADKKIVLITGD
jgi:phosphoglycerate dehydrogenase-like enzyme